VTAAGLMSARGDVQAVVFNLGGETFALPVGTVREILDHRDAFRMPQGPAWLAGLIEVRGEAIPMVDLRIRLGMAAAAIGVTTRVLVVDVPVGAGTAADGADDGARQLTLGLIVDRVLDVASFPAGAIETTPDIGVRWRSDYIDGVVRRPDGFVVLLAAGPIFSGDDDAFVALDRAA
jgi:purine-binding chemotaxis protein CheW